MARFRAFLQAKLPAAWACYPSLMAPPFGNRLAEIGAGIPFLFWASLTMVGIIVLLIQEGHRETVVTQLPAKI